MMQFTYNNNNNNNNNENLRSQNMLANYGKTQRQSLTQLTKSVPIQTIQPQTVNANSTQDIKMTWGPPIWFLFHTLAEKIRVESFYLIKTSLLNNIYSICSNLPCPICTNHAIDYLNKINFNNIQSKEELIKMLYTFHNEVNKRKKLELFSYNEVETKYKTAITKNVIVYFMLNYEKKTKNVRMPSNEFHRKNLIIILKKWFNENMHHFNP